MNDAFSTLSLPAAIRAQASQLLAAIKGASGLAELLREAGRAEGFVLGIETVHALGAIDVENLYAVIESAAQKRHAELSE
ncbi:hypothetical protein [Pseudomonas sp. GM80]|uniref:hypothetical protein n=1 Tax=Pseudomonas sp. GM80 TaxID=1144339 RepID=UPI00026F8CE2|nr:hypothetical protein [Pseudomonas sp. GM80]EJN18653.1 hypothetical protein PMI37_05683 [Pseudomonas sp. GM80]